jgi:hypothetical protein
MRWYGISCRKPATAPGKMLGAEKQRGLNHRWGLDSFFPAEVRGTLGGVLENSVQPVLEELERATPELGELVDVNEIVFEALIMTG